MNLYYYDESWIVCEYVLLKRVWIHVLMSHMWMTHYASMQEYFHTHDWAWMWDWDLAHQYLHRPICPSTLWSSLRIGLERRRARANCLLDRQKNWKYEVSEAYLGKTWASIAARIEDNIVATMAGVALAEEEKRLISPSHTVLLMMQLA